MLNMGLLLAMSIQDYYKKYITTSMLLLVWAISIISLIVQGFPLHVMLVVKLGIGILATLIWWKIGWDNFMGRGDYFVLIWLLVFGEFFEVIRAISYGLLILCMFVFLMKAYYTTRKIKHPNEKNKLKNGEIKKITRKQELPLIPFLWIGYFLMWMERVVI